MAGHVCLDIIPPFVGSAATVAPGRLVEVGPPLITSGGAVSNTGLALHRLGTRVRLVARAGDDRLAQLLTDVLHAAGCRQSLSLARVVGETTSYSIVLSPPSTDRSFLHCPGANQSFARADVAPTLLEGARILHVGYPPLMQRLWQDQGRELALLLADAKARGVATSVDFAMPDPASPAARAPWPRILARVLPYTDFFLPSIDEMLLLLRRREFLARREAGKAAVPRLALVREIGEQLLQLGAFAVGLKLGERGLALFTQGAPRSKQVGGRISLSPAWRNRAILHPCFAPRRVAGTTGAGDAAVAGFLTAVLEGAIPEQAARLACAVGCCSVEQPDAVSGIPTRAVIGARLQRGWRQQRDRVWATGSPTSPSWWWDRSQRCWQGR